MSATLEQALEWARNHTPGPLEWPAKPTPETCAHQGDTYTVRAHGHAAEREFCSACGALLTGPGTRPNPTKGKGTRVQLEVHGMQDATRALVRLGRLGPYTRRKPYVHTGQPDCTCGACHTARVKRMGSSIGKGELR